MRIYRPTYKKPDGTSQKSGRYWLDFADAEGRRQRLAGLTDQRATKSLAANVERLLAIRTAGDALPSDLLRWLEQIPAAIRGDLAKAGLIEKDRAGGLRPLMELDGEHNIIGGHLYDFLQDAMRVAFQRSSD